MFDNDGDSNHTIIKVSTLFHGRAESSRATQYKAISTLLIFISGPDLSTQLQSWHSSVLGWFGVAVAVFLRLQYSHIGLDQDPPCACNKMFSHL